MQRTTPIKNELYKTDVYLKHKKLIYKLAWEHKRHLSSLDYDFDDIVSEFNIIFCECIKKYKPSKGCFSTFLFRCCKNRIYNLIKVSNEPKRNQAKRLHFEERLDFENSITDEITTEDKFIFFDAFVNNSDKVVKTIAKIISIYEFPNKAPKTWLKNTLRTYGFSYPQITKAFKIIKTLY